MNIIAYHIGSGFVVKNSRLSKSKLPYLNEEGLKATTSRKGEGVNMDVIEKIMGVEKDSETCINIGLINGLSKAVDKAVKDGEFKKLPVYRLTPKKDRPTYMVDLIYSAAGDSVWYEFPPSFDRGEIKIFPAWSDMTISAPASEIPACVVYDLLLNYAMDHFA